MNQEETSLFLKTIKLSEFGIYDNGYGKKSIVVGIPKNDYRRIALSDTAKFRIKTKITYDGFVYLDILLKIDADVFSYSIQILPEMINMFSKYGMLTFQQSPLIVDNFRGFRYEFTSDEVTRILKKITNEDVWT